jgi:hypothetical protein
MQSHFELTDHEFEIQFQSASFPPALFTHEAHIRLAWVHIKKYGCEKAIENITGQLMDYVKTIGATGKYNHTLTIGAVKAVNHFINKSASSNFAGFIKEFPRLLSNFKDLMAYHYSGDIYNSETAKQQFVEPDLLPFS